MSIENIPHMQTKSFSRVKILERFQITETKEQGIRIELDCVIGVQFKVNAVRTSGEEKGRLFFVKPRTKVKTRS